MTEILEETPEEIESKQKPRIAWGRVLRQSLAILRELAETILPAIVIAIFINLFLVQATQVLGQSMEPNLHTHQRVLVEKVTYRFFHAPQRGDIVVIDLDPKNTADDLLIKRIIGLPGDIIEIRGGEVYIDNELLQEPWMTNVGGGNYGPKTIPPLNVFVMGDNRGASNDSRSFGPVPVDNIVGRAWFSYWPPEEMGLIK
ncbi:MAG: signal peptidase I [Anaerolineae bacterium]|jgi:signal peptidase I